MNPVDMIVKISYGGELTAAELQYFVKGFVVDHS